MPSGSIAISTDNLFNRAFIDSFNGDGEAGLKANIAENNIYNWKPATPTILFHGQGDDMVSYANAATALKAMTGNNATGVSIHNCNAGSLPTTHMNCELPYLVDMMATFSTMAANL